LKLGSSRPKFRAASTPLECKHSSFRLLNLGKLKGATMSENDPIKFPRCNGAKRIPPVSGPYCPEKDGCGGYGRVSEEEGKRLAALLADE
jgi:hypothetical protein